MKPSRWVPANEMRAAMSSVSGPVSEALACRKPKLPYDSSTAEPGVKLGFLVVTLIAPAVVFFPYSVPCGPLSTSICSTSMKSSVAAAGRAK